LRFWRFVVDAREMRIAVVVVLLTACSSPSEPSSEPMPDAADAATDVLLATDFGIDSSPSCPDYFPGDGNACGVSMPCTFKDSMCGGTFVGECKDGLWTSGPHAQCGPYCPPNRPEPGSSCASYPAGRQCSFWPVTKDVCESCTCTEGKWACGATCSMKLGDCKTGTACTANTGCGAGRCNSFCACGVDGALHCSANPC
jgi:hypothetical protein